VPTLPRPNDSKFLPVPEGNHVAACYRIVDFGTQTILFSGKEKKQHKILISWEIPDEKMEDGRPFTIGQRFTWSMSKKATLRKSLESWRGLPFNEADFGVGGFDIKKLLGAGCMLNVVHQHEDGDTYANIASIARLPKGIFAPKPTNPYTFIWLTPEEFDVPSYNALTDKMKEIIMKSPEYQAILNPAAPVFDDSNSTPRTLDDLDQEIPF
jgi:hypothetical protein